MADNDPTKHIDDMLIRLSSLIANFTRDAGGPAIETDVAMRLAIHCAQSGDDPAAFIRDAIVLGLDEAARCADWKEAWPALPSTSPEQAGGAA